MAPWRIDGWMSGTIARSSEIDEVDLRVGDYHMDGTGLWEEIGKIYGKS